MMSLTYSSFLVPVAENPSVFYTPLHTFRCIAFREFLWKTKNLFQYTLQTFPSHLSSLYFCFLLTIPFPILCGLSLPFILIACSRLSIYIPSCSDFHILCSPTDSFGGIFWNSIYTWYKYNFSLPNCSLEHIKWIFQCLAYFRRALCNKNMLRRVLFKWQDNCLLNCAFILRPED